MAIYYSEVIILKTSTPAAFLDSRYYIVSTVGPITHSLYLIISRNNKDSKLLLVPNSNL